METSTTPKAITWKCGWPCHKVFISESALQAHCDRKPKCRAKWAIIEERLSQESIQKASERRQDDLQAIQNQEPNLHEGQSYALDEQPDAFNQDEDMLFHEQDTFPRNSDLPNHDPDTFEQNQSRLNHAHNVVGPTPYTGYPEALPMDEDFADGTQSDISSHGDSDEPSDSDEPLDSDANPSLEVPDSDDLLDDYLGQEIDDTVGPPESGETPYLSDPESSEDGGGEAGSEPVHNSLDGVTDMEMNQDPPEDDQDQDSIEIESFPHAGGVKTEENPHFAELVVRQTSKGANTPYHPFFNASEFEFVKWANDIPVAKVDSLLKLDWASDLVNTNGEASFASGKTMRERMNGLPKPRMSWETVEVIPRSGTTTAPVYLCYRDPVDAIRSLLDRPQLAEHMTYIPQRHWKDKSTGKRHYSEVFTGDWAWETQATLQEGATLIPVILGSDKAHLTEHSGNKSAWPLYMSIGNIHSQVRNKPSARCWILIAYIPIPVFKEHKKIKTTLQSRLFHQCLKLVLHSIQTVGEHGDSFTDSLGHCRLCYTRIAAYLADYPEQILINISKGKSAANTTAQNDDLGDSSPHPRRTREWLLSRLERLRSTVDTDDVQAYITAAGKLGLNGVDQPFWEDMIGYEPDLITCPDILHGLFRFWRDHPLDWVQWLVGEVELDRRLRAMQPLSGMRHFKDGISHLSQWSGRDDRELMKVLLVAIAGAPKIDRVVMRCMRALHDFIYLAQYRSHSTTTLGYLKQSLKVFHSLKRVFISNGARRGDKKKANPPVIPHFKGIPKLAALHNYEYHIPRMGSSIQFSTEITETCHQSMAKAAYRATNHKDFFKQMCSYLNRQAALALADEVAAFCFRELQKAGYVHVPAGLRDDYHVFHQKEREATEKHEKETTKRRVRADNNYLWVNKKPDKRNVSVEWLKNKYKLQGFPASLTSFLSEPAYAQHGCFVMEDVEANVWYCCHVQRLVVQDDEQLSDARAIRAIPPGVHDSRYGRCNCALIRQNDEAEVTGMEGYRIAQLRMIFLLKVPRRHPLYGVLLAYVYWFSNPLSTAEPDINMYKVRYQRKSDMSRIGSVIPLCRVHRLVQLVPVYGPSVNPGLTAANSMDAYDSYYVNSFMDKETYQAIY